MGQVTFVEHDGTDHEVGIEEGASLMRHAVDNLVPGIDADCGGDASCGTCHVIVDQGWYDRTGSIGDDEQLMLDMTPERADTSRLACQIEVTEELDGLQVTLPEFQM
ncbi:2Fe-2S iron-sulfur cluster binding domain-containing protein [Nocardioidaceae bacterium]|nr:2Fe-2S iron-sulfur cluster binding domain-containing protein [Nocardioidaceae bacterium]